MLTGETCLLLDYSIATGRATFTRHGVPILENLCFDQVAVALEFDGFTKPLSAINPPTTNIAVPM